MRIQTKHDSETSITITISADEALLAKAKALVVQKLGRELRLPGFRPGKAPAALLERSIDDQQLQAEFLDVAVNRMYVDAITAENLRPVTDPQVSLKKFVPYTELQVEIAIEVVGEVKLPELSKIKLSPEKPADVTKLDVEGVIDNLKRRLAAKVAVDRGAKTGDEVILDFDGVDAAGKSVNGASAKEYPLILGSKSFIPGFEEELAGLKKDATKTFDIVFPKDYQVKALANKKVTFSILIREVNELEDPEVDDEFAKQSGPFATVEELRDDIKKQLTLEAQTETRQKFENELVADIVGKAKVAIPAAMTERQLEQMEQEEKQNILYRGQTWQEHLDEEGVTAEEHRERQRPSAEQTIKSGLVLSAIAEQENITLTSDDIDQRVRLLKERYTDKAMRAELDKPENRRDVEGRLLAEKTIAHLVNLVSKQPIA